MITEAQMLQRLKDFVKGAGSQRQAAIKLGVSPQFMVDVLKGRRRVGATIAKYFGLEPATCRRRSQPQQSAIGPNAVEGETVSQRYIRQARERLDAAGRKKEEAMMAPKANRPYMPRFTTNAAIDWIKANGGIILAVEEDQAYQDRNGHWQRRKRDQKHVADVIYRHHGKVFGLQAAGVGERARHWEKFLNSGGVDAAKVVYDEFLYVEFERGEVNPSKVEKWVG